jgi:hypothetical protein
MLEGSPVWAFADRAVEPANPDVEATLETSRELRSRDVPTRRLRSAWNDASIGSRVPGNPGPRPRRWRARAVR